MVPLGEDGQQETCEIASLQRTDLKPETLSLTLAEGKMILKDLQQILVEGRPGFPLPKRPCPECGQPRSIKEVITHELLRGPFGVESRLISSKVI